MGVQLISNKYDFAIIGGDLRQAYMFLDLIDKGYSVVVYGFSPSSIIKEDAFGKSLEEVMSSSRNLIIAIPFSVDKVHLKSQTNQADLTIENFINNLSSYHRIYGGSFNHELISSFDKKQVFYCDLMKKEEIMLYNSIATAEGAIAEALINSTCNLHDSSILVLGFGRCGKTLANKLKGLSENVNIAIRSSRARFEALTLGFNTVNFKDLKNHIDQFDFVFNTVPKLVLIDEILDKTKIDLTIIDIASSPGGIDYNYAEKINRNAKLCLGLPGKYSPKSSAEFLSHCILSDLRK